VKLNCRAALQNQHQLKTSCTNETNLDFGAI